MWEINNKTRYDTNDARHAQDCTQVLKKWEESNTTPNKDDRLFETALILKLHVHQFILNLFAICVGSLYEAGSLDIMKIRGRSPMTDRVKEIFLVTAHKAFLPLHVAIIS